jgi:hypothetical protein
MHDGALACFSHAVQAVLSNTYHDQWTGRGGPTVWPPCSPDLNPLDFTFRDTKKPLWFMICVEVCTTSHVGHFEHLL